MAGTIKSFNTAKKPTLSDFAKSEKAKSNFFMARKAQQKKSDEVQKRLGAYMSGIKSTGI